MSVRLATIFDPSGDRVGDPAERARIAEFLAAGTVLLFTTATEVDRLDPSRGQVVGLTLRTDGVWAWSDALTYYVTTHGLTPEADLYDHIRAGGYACEPVDAATTDRVIDELRSSRRS